ncbi:hypothetical protein [Helicobacter mustelae]|nr:hypothetical protein [Helicobacter mustelae]SQH71689.1 putative integral membrane protein [Helicobacter mustelae]
MNLFKSLVLYLRLWFHLTHQTSRRLDIMDILFVCIACSWLFLLLFMVGEISLSQKEAWNFFFNEDPFFTAFRAIFHALAFLRLGGDYTLKIPLLFLNICNLFLLYGICRHTLRHKCDSLIAILICITLPAVNFSALLLVESGWVLFLSLLICYFLTRYKQVPLFLLFFLALLSSGVLILSLGIALFMLKTKHYKTAIFCLACAILNYCLYDFGIDGIPRGYFLDTLGQLALLYSPLLFVYYVYSIYWGIVHKQSLLAYIAGTSLVFCILLSLRQNIDFYTLAPQSLVGIPVMVQCFLNDLRTHLPQFRTKHYIISSILLFALFLQTAMIFGNKITYFFSDKPNFAANYYFSKEIARALKDYGITAIKAPKSLTLPLQFYGIQKGGDFILEPTKSKKADIQIRYNHTAIVRFNLEKK